MIAQPAFTLDWNAILERNGTVLSALVLAVIFAPGAVDALILKKKDWACATWFLGVVSLSA
jgi:hypothetical protein